MRFQERDGAILETIYAYGGVLARRQIKELFWPQSSPRPMEVRLRKLRLESYIDWPSQEQRRTKPIPEPVVWLGWKGILYVAARGGARVDPPSSEAEYQLKGLRKQLREKGFPWLREPRWIQLTHDLSVVDFRIMVEKALAVVPFLSLDLWINEGAFLSDADKITYEDVGKDRVVRRRKKLIRPDSYFVIIDERRQRQGKERARAKFLLELDGATQTRHRFVSEKVVPGIAYIRSDAYKQRFGDNIGHWLVVTTGAIRREHLMARCRAKAGAGATLFLFTTMEKVTAPDVLRGPIWYRPGQREPIPLFTT